MRDEGSCSPRRAGRGTGGRAGVAILCCLIALLTACSGTSTPPRADGPSSTLSDNPAAQARAAAVAAYIGMWHDMAIAAATADWRSPILAEHVTGTALSLLIRTLYTDRRLGYVIKGRPVPHPSVVSATPSSDPTKVNIRDCFDDTHWLVYIAATGHLKNNVPGGHHYSTAVVVLSAGSWKVSELNTTGQSC